MSCPQKTQKCLLTFKTLNSALKLQQLTAGKSGWAEFHPWRKCFIPKVQILLHSKACCSFTTEQSKGRDILAAAEEVLQVPQQHRGGQGCFASGPGLPGQLELLPLPPHTPILSYSKQFCSFLLCDKENWGGDELPDPVPSAVPILSLSSSTKFQHIPGWNKLS